jgi:uncharacterized protein with HEPN domain
MIEFGSVEYFTLLKLRDLLCQRQYNNLDLKCLDTLKNELDIKIKKIELTYYETKNK